MQQRHGVELTAVGALGVSAMMHGYLAFDADGELLDPVPDLAQHQHRRGRRAAQRRSSGYNIPHRWSVAHLYQAILDGEDHVGRIAHLTTLAGYVHWQLTGEKVLGIGDASGMFPIDIAHRRLRRRACWPGSTELAAEAGADLRAGRPAADDPARRRAGRRAHRRGRELLDPTGRLRPGIPMCPPEGDAGTGMVATNSVAPRTGNVSAGTSIFAMVVLEHELSRVHRELDLVTTPAGDLVAMVHCNNGASELERLGRPVRRVRRGARRSTRTPRRSSRRCSAPRWTAPPTAAGCWPTTTCPASRSPGSTRAGRCSCAPRTAPSTWPPSCAPTCSPSLATLRIGMDVLQKDEGVRLDRMFAHGGLFTTKGVAQRFLAAAIDTPVSVGDVAAEGGAWGIAVLAAFLTGAAGESLADYLDAHVFAGAGWKPPTPTRPSWPASTPSSSGTSPRCRSSRPPSTTPDDRVSQGSYPLP